MSTTPTNIPNSIEIITTGDGSDTLYNKKLKEPYHSTFGALQESLHLFINHGWEHLHNHPGPVAVFEVGFGTGLNALLTALKAVDDQRKVLYASLELTPLPEEIWKRLNYPDRVELMRTEAGSHHQRDQGRTSDDSTIQPSVIDLFSLIHSAPWETVEAVSPWFHLLKLQGDLFNFTLPDLRFDLIYFDAFGPDVQPVLWSEEVFDKMVQLLKPQGLLITYSCKGTVKRNLRAAGFTLEKIPGPPGKRECLRAWKR